MDVFTILLSVHLILAVALIGVVLLQRSEGGALGIGGGGGGLMSGRAAGNLLTRTTAILAACFFGMSVALAIVVKNQAAEPSILDTMPPASTTPAAPAAEMPPAEPAAPLSR